MAHVKDCIKLAERTIIDDRYDMGAADMQAIYDAFKDDAARLMITCFKYGYAQGQKARTADGPTTYARRKESARQYAIRRAQWLSEHDVSYAELARTQDDILKVARKYGLVREFKENGIL